MADKYIAVGTVGSFAPEQEVTGLTAGRYKELEEAGKVRLVVEKAATPTKTTKK